MVPVNDRNGEKNTDKNHHEKNTEKNNDKNNGYHPQTKPKKILNVDDSPPSSSPTSNGLAKIE